MRDPKADLRPLTGLALKSCRDVLRSRIPGARVLDLFAGRGRFAQMCMEEGAASAVLVERDRDLERDLASIGQVFVEDVFGYLGGAGKFDIIFADPPYSAWNAAFSEALMTAVFPHLTVGGIFLVKSPKRVIFLLEFSGFRELKRREFGETSLTYLEPVQ